MDDDSETGSLNQPPSSHTVISSMIKFNFAYVTNTWFGRLKVMELLSAMLAGCILPSVIGVFFTRYSFYTFVIWTCFMYIFIDLFIHVTSLARLLPRSCAAAKSGIMMYLLIIGAIALLISCSLVAGVANYHYLINSTQTGVSLFFGYLLMVLFLIESYLHHKESTKPPRGDGDDDDGDIDDTDSHRRMRLEISGPIYKPQDNPPPYRATTTNVGGGGGGNAQPVGGYS